MISPVGSVAEFIMSKKLCICNYNLGLESFHSLDKCASDSKFFLTILVK